MIFIPQKYEKNNQYVWEVEILTATKTTVLNQNLCCWKLLMLLSDVMVISMLKNTQWDFYGIHGMS